MRRSAVASCLVVICGSVGLSAGDDTPQKKDAATLVKELGSPSYLVREAAERQLKEVGFVALPAIKAGLISTDSEVASRCKKLIGVIRIASAPGFVEGKHDHDSPAWASFKAVVGDSKVSRLLFVDMMADDRRADAIERAEANPSQAHKLYLAELEGAKRVLDEAIKPFMGQEMDADVSRAVRKALLSALTLPELTTVLFLGRNPIPNGESDPAPPYYFFSTGFEEGIRGAANHQACALFGAWFSQRRDPAAIKNGLMAALAFELKDAIPTARRVATTKTTDPGVIACALIVIGHHGTREDLPLVYSFRKDDRPTMTIFSAKGEWVKTMPLGDVAAAMALRLYGEDFEKYGFEGKATNYPHIRDRLASYHGLVPFKSEEARAAALKKAWEFLDRQPKAEAPPP
jgi:hypothetical protein